MSSCIFCDIINRIAEAHIIYEDDLVCCFLDKFPINPGHVLVVPKRHAQEFTDVDPESLKAVILAAQKATRAIESAFGTDGITVMQNNGAFKDVEHYHMHIVPRYKGDGFGWTEPEIDLASVNFDFLEKKIRGAMQE
ncbi:HIT family hydrolase [Bhargavaea cecembensis]|uniref:HIT family hydrolase n=1 Tax=Bhargavaea cecembensis TaxID=394098 RepID=A0A161RCF9_9BACL|nr:HIT family protein [Bhargavaea cecembensis]KZE37212.1 HIT family hydrolase [Bhargavaea cecembensis]